MPAVKKASRLSHTDNMIHLTPLLQGHQESLSLSPSKDSVNKSALRKKITAAPFVSPPQARFSNLVQQTAPNRNNEVVHVNAKLTGPMAELWKLLTLGHSNSSQILREAIRVRAFLEDQMLMNHPVATVLADGTKIDDLCRLLDLQPSRLNDKVRMPR